MATTFTGLKLQGQLGKFGATELSDVSSFVFLGDGKILSTTETGNLLIWENGFIKCELTAKGKKPCHEGRIDVLKIVESDIVTGGDDGYVRIWNLDAIKNAQVLQDENANTGSSSARTVEIEPIDEILVGKDLRIKGVAYSAHLGTYAVQCGNGTLYKLDLQHSIVEPLFKFPAGSLMTAANPLVPGLISLGEDGTLRLYSSVDKKVIAEKSYAVAGTALKYLGGVSYTIQTSHCKALDQQECTFAAGYNDGTLRFFSHDYIHLRSAKFHLMSAFKPHSKPVSGIFCNPDATFLITAADDKTLFLFSTGCVRVAEHLMSGKDLKIGPVGFVGVGTSVKEVVFLEGTGVNCVRVLVLYKTGATAILSIDLAGWDAEESFELPTSRITVLANTLLDVPTIVPADVVRSNERLDVKAVLMITSESLITSLLIVDADWVVVGVLNCNGVTEIRLVQLSNPSASIVLSVCKAPVSTLSIKRGSLLLGCTDGSILIHPFDLSKLKPTLSSKHAIEPSSIDTTLINLHGDVAIVSITFSWDGSAVYTSDAAGGFFISRNLNQSPSFTEPDQMVTYTDATVDDIFAATHYTLQENKIKSEKDKETQESERKKTMKRAELSVLRKELAEVYEDISRLALDADFPRAEMRIDPNLHREIETLRQVQMDDLKDEFSWESQKIDIQLTKMKALFVKSLKTYDMSVTDFAGSTTVECFRSIVPISQSSSTSNATAADTEDSRRHLRTITNTASRDDVNPLLKTHAVSKYDAKRHEKALRVATWKHLMTTKPDDTYEDVNDVQAIKQAYECMGDYKLKTSREYVLPDEEQVGVDGKWAQLKALEQSIFELQEGFNSRVGVLKGQKGMIGEGEQGANARLQKYNKFLAENGEGQFNYFQSIVDTAVINPEHAIECSVSAFKPEVFVKCVVPEKSKEQIQKCVIVQYRASHLIESFARIREEFDADVKALYCDRINLNCDINFANMHSINIFLEWQLLKGFEKTEKLIQDKLQSKKIERTDISNKIHDCFAKLAGKKDQVKMFVQREADVFEELKVLIGENNKHELFLIKIFKKKIKRTKKKYNEEGELVEDFSDEEMSDSDDFSENEETQEKEENMVEIRPDDCATAMWEGMLALRESRLDNEDELDLVQKAIDGLKKEHDTYLKKEKIVESGLKGVESEMKDFQYHKQQKINELDVIVPLHPHMIYYDDLDYTNSLVISKVELAKLKERVSEIQKERMQVRKDHNQLRKAHMDLNLSRKEKQDKIQVLKEKVEEAQMLKFGRLVDIEKLEKLGSKKISDELRAQMFKATTIQENVIAEWDKRIKASKVEFTQQLNINTQLLSTKTTIEQQKLQKETTQNLLSKDKAKHVLITSDEIHEMEHKLRLQDIEIATLSKEVRSLLLK